MNETGNIGLHKTGVDRRPRPIRSSFACPVAASPFQSFKHRTGGDPVATSGLMYTIEASSPEPIGICRANSAGQIAIACGKG